MLSNKKIIEIISIFQLLAASIICIIFSSQEYIELPEVKSFGGFTNKIDKTKMMNEDNGLSSGDKVIHDAYGSGIVVSIDGSIATIAFKGVGIKKLMKNHKSIKKV